MTNIHENGPTGPTPEGPYVLPGSVAAVLTEDRLIRGLALSWALAFNASATKPSIRAVVRDAYEFEAYLRTGK